MKKTTCTDDRNRAQNLPTIQDLGDMAEEARLKLQFVQVGISAMRLEAENIEFAPEVYEGAGMVLQDICGELAEISEYRKV